MSSEIHLQLIHSLINDYTFAFAVLLALVCTVLYTYGSGRNSKAAATWFKFTEDLWKGNFSCLNLVQNGSELLPIQEGPNNYKLHATGRENVNSVSVELNLPIYTDPIAIMYNLFKFQPMETELIMQAHIKRNPEKPIVLGIFPVGKEYSLGRSNWGIRRLTNLENSNLIGFPKKDYKILSENCKYVRDLLQEPSMKEFMWKSAGKTPDGKRIEEEKLKLCPRINHLTISEISESIPEDEKSIYLPDVMIDLNLTIPYPTKSDPEISTTCKEAVQFFLDLIDLFEISGKLNLEELEEVRKVREKVFSDLNEKEEGLKRKREKERLEKLKKDDIDRLSKMDEEERSKVIRKRNERKIKKQMLKKSGSRLVG